MPQPNEFHINISTMNPQPRQRTWKNINLNNNLLGGSSSVQQAAWDYGQSVAKEKPKPDAHPADWAAAGGPSLIQQLCVAGKFLAASSFVHSDMTSFTLHLQSGSVCKNLQAFICSFVFKEPKGMGMASHFGLNAVQ